MFIFQLVTLYLDIGIYSHLRFRELCPGAVAAELPRPFKGRQTLQDLEVSSTDLMKVTSIITVIVSAYRKMTSSYGKPQNFVSRSVRRNQIQNMTSRLRSSDISISVGFYQNYIIFILHYSYIIQITFIQN